MISYACTTAGGIEEDLIKCFGDYQIRDFNQVKVDPDFEQQGNIYIPKSAQQQFKEFFKTQIRKMHDKQNIKQKKIWSPSKIIKELGMAINNPQSVVYWAAKNDVGLFCPAFTDGFIGECLYEYNEEHPGFLIDVASDVFEFNNTTQGGVARSAAIILGGGISKHHVLNANLLRNGCESAVNFLRL